MPSRAALCPDCGADAGDNWFDRSICPEPCGSMHTRCSNCGGAYGECAWDVVVREPAPASTLERLRRRVLSGDWRTP